IPLLSKHATAGQGIGDVTYIRIRRDDVYIRADLHETAAADHAWRLIERGELRGLSAGLSHGPPSPEGEGARVYDRWTMAEVSVVRNGANADCYFEIAK